nr:hypothetical protein [Tanacetum cinerariifolium]
MFLEYCQKHEDQLSFRVDQIRFMVIAFMVTNRCFDHCHHVKTLQSRINHVRYQKDFPWRAQGKIPKVESKPNTAKFLHLQVREDNARRGSQS